MALASVFAPLLAKDVLGNPLFWLAYLAVGLFAIWVFISVINSVKQIKIRQERFASELGYYYIDTAAIELGGSIKHTTVDDIVCNREEIIWSDVVFGNISELDGEGKHKSYQGIVRFKLDNNLPHIIFDSKNQRGGINTFEYRQSQLFDLEGDFVNTFEVYCPKEYERDALYLFTPDIMLLMVNYGHAYDIELYDNYIYIYLGKKLAYSSAELDPLATFANEFVSMVLHKSKKYKDLSSDVHGEVSKQGRRLKKSYVIGAIVTIAVVFFEIGPRIVSNTDYFPYAFILAMIALAIANVVARIRK